MLEVEPEKVERDLQRAEWGVVVSLLISAATAVFTGGVIYGQIQAQGTRLTRVETMADQNRDLISTQTATVARIDANVQILLGQRSEERSTERERDRRP